MSCFFRYALVATLAVGCKTTNTSAVKDATTSEQSAGATAPAAGSLNALLAVLHQDQNPPTLPTQNGASDVQVTESVAPPFDTIPDLLSAQRALIRDPSDLRAVDAGDGTMQAKRLHPKGVCAEASWAITGDTPYTGLFAKGATVQGVMRLSVGGNNTGPDKQLLGHNVPLVGLHRMFGVALKLFPAPSGDQAANSLNILAFDQVGPGGNPSPWFLRNDQDDSRSTQFFSNWMFGYDLLTLGFEKQFGRRWAELAKQNGGPKPPPRLVPVGALAAVDADGSSVASPAAPTFVKLVPHAHYLPAESDFRNELLQYRDGEITFDIVLVDGNSNQIAGAWTPVGTVTLGQPFLSPACDYQLRFMHGQQ